MYKRGNDLLDIVIDNGTDIFIELTGRTFCVFASEVR